MEDIPTTSSAPAGAVRWSAWLGVADELGLTVEQKADSIERCILGDLWAIRNTPVSEEELTRHLVDITEARRILRKIRPNSTEANPLSRPFLPPIACKELPLSWKVELAMNGFRETSVTCSIDQALERPLKQTVEPVRRSALVCHKQENRL